MFCNFEVTGGKRGDWGGEGKGKDAGASGSQSTSELEDPAEAQKKELENTNPNEALKHTADESSKPGVTQSTASSSSQVPNDETP